MTPREKEILARFLEQLTSARAGQKDVEADGLIRDAAAKQPDATYLLAQRTLQLEQLLQASQAQVQKLQADLDQASSGARGGGFLNDPNAWGSRPAAPAPAPTPVAQPQAAAPAARGSWGSGLFGNIATTAAGVVAGSFLYQGIQGLMHRNDTNPAAAAAHKPEQTASNEPELLNSYDTSADTGSDTLADLGGDQSDYA